MEKKILKRKYSLTFGMYKPSKFFTLLPNITWDNNDIKSLSLSFLMFKFIIDNNGIEMIQLKKRQQNKKLKDIINDMKKHSNV